MAKKVFNSMQLTQMSIKVHQMTLRGVENRSAAESAGELPSLTITKRQKSPTNVATKLVSAKNKKKSPKLRRHG